MYEYLVRDLGAFASETAMQDELNKMANMGWRFHSVQSFLTFKWVIFEKVIKTA
jgi:hypothetical protein